MLRDKWKANAKIFDSVSGEFSTSIDIESSNLT